MTQLTVTLVTGSSDISPIGRIASDPMNRLTLKKLNVERDILQHQLKILDSARHELQLGAVPGTDFNRTRPL